MNKPVKTQDSKLITSTLIKQSPKLAFSTDEWKIKSFSVISDVIDKDANLKNFVLFAEPLIDRHTDKYIIMEC